jgi:rfaE bifunctional protein kinase chain/domain
MTRILVVGDTIIDRHWYCTPKAVSPEAPILTWQVDRIVDKPGGAANVVNNLHSLIKILNEERIKVSFVSSISKELLECIPAGFPIDASLYSDLPPTIKNRIIFPDPHQQIVRFDQDNNLCKSDEANLVGRIASGYYDIGLVSDYSHGGVTDKVLEVVRSTCNLVVIDPKGDDPGKYTGIADIITPNKKELSDLVPTNESEILKVRSLSFSIQGSREEVPRVVYKKGEDGCVLYNGSFNKFEPYRTEKRVLDPTGAGDTFIAALVFYTAIGISLRRATKEANRLAGISVTFPNCWIPEKEYVR